MGVLATVQTMEPSTRSLLSPVDPAALDSGMQFLRLASRHSVLAARYVALLERLEDRCTGGNDVLLSSCPQNEGSAQGRSDGHAYINQNGTHAAMDHAPLHSDYQAFTGLESLDPLFGFGMTQNFLTPEWV